jgi:hypothetical protein
VTGLSHTSYRPELRFTNLGPANQYAQGAGSDVSPLAGALAGGSYDQNQFASLGDPTKECVGIQEAAGLHIVPLPEVPKGGQRQLAGSFDACQQLYLLKAILQGAGKDLNFGTFKAAGDSLGDIVLPFAPDTWHFGAPPHADGDPVVHIYEFDPAKSIFVMTN